MGSKAGGKEKSLRCISFVKGRDRIFLSFVSIRDRQSDGETCVGESRHEWR